jgi:hypothetical protein
MKKEAVCELTNQTRSIQQLLLKIQWMKPTQSSATISFQNPVYGQFLIYFMIIFQLHSLFNAVREM